MWQINKEKTESHWLELFNEEEQIEVVVKWDGCTHYNQYRNGTMGLPDDQQEVDYLHICSIDDMIETLQQIRAEAVKFFGKDWEEFYS